MGAMSWVHWVLVIGVAALLFGGGGKLSGLMGDAAKGIRAFRELENPKNIHFFKNMAPEDFLRVLQLDPDGPAGETVREIIQQMEIGEEPRP